LRHQHEAHGGTIAKAEKRRFDSLWP
jgi:hypothetical protein